MLRLVTERNALSPLGTGRWKRWTHLAHNESGFTLIELLVVIVLVGITSAMFEATFGTIINRSSAVQAQNIMQTEVRASLNQAVSDLRDATTRTTTPPIIDYQNNQVVFYSPDRLTPGNLRKVRYWLEGPSTGAVLKRRVTTVTSYDAQGNPIDPGDTGPVETIVASVQTPAIAAQPDAPQSGWAAGQIFKYCAQNPLDLAPLQDSQSPDPITWTCTNPGSNDNIKTIVVRAAISATPTSTRYTYGAVATLRWNAS